ncbi:MAG: class II aldolase/adducin family protein [Spirochaetota bacterium]
MHDDGYIKFSLRREEAGPPVFDTELLALNGVRTMLYDMGLVGVLPDGIGYGNVSIRRGGSFIISGSATGSRRILDGTGYSEVTAADIPGNSLVCRGTVDASSESLSHAALYDADPGVACVIHIHSRKLFDDMIKHGDLSTPQDAAYGTPKIASALAGCVRSSGPRGAAVMRGHQDGVIAWGRTVDEAMDEIRTLCVRAGGC